MTLRHLLFPLLVLITACDPGSETLCEDMLDNDADGFVDCDDQDCAGNAACTEGDTDTDSDADTDTDTDADADTDTDVPLDEDEDGYISDTDGGDDCDDEDDAIHPGADEHCNGVDDDCDGDTDEDDAVDASTWYSDSDGDGYGDASDSTVACEAPTGMVGDATDCDDDEATIYPAADELVADGIDQDCDGVETCYEDADGDGYGSSATVLSKDLYCEDTGEADTDTDPDDSDGSTYPGAPEIPGDGIDQDGDGADICFVDDDGDGFGTTSTVASSDLDCTDSGESTLDSDCDDADATTFPGADEYCDGHDDDCDGDTDEDASVDASTWYADVDLDGYGDPLSTSSACGLPSGYVADDSDCDDSSASTHPSADEYCDGVDTDCDGTTDEDAALDASTWYADADTDGYGDTSSTADACVQPSGYVADATDCDDADTSVNPGAAETCNSVDDDCDTDVDESDAVDAATWYADADGDGHGTPDTSTVSCSEPSGYVEDSDDCDDGAAGVYTGAEEAVADGIDQDCNDGDTCYQDSDGDSYGSTTTMASADLDCSDSGEASTGGDLDDSDGSTFPGATEVIADGIDQDCDGGDICYEDLDRDGYGTSATVASTDLDCADSGESAVSTDCDDDEVTSYPGADEYCDGHDDDCDGDTDEVSAVDATTWYADSDGDLFGDPLSTDHACDQPSGYVADGTDCDDTSTSLNPGASETAADGIDQDCDGGDTCYEDADGDGFGATTSVTSTDLDCSDAGEAATADDFDDDESSAYPGASEVVADGIDQDGDGGEVCYEDLDGDGYGTSSTVVSEDLDCSGDGESGADSDLDDGDGSSYPGAPEVVADGIDQDGDGGDTCYEDVDLDGYGSTSTVASVDLDCSDAGEGTLSTDCDDGDSAINPGATETWYDGVDGDCSDDSDYDADGDGYDSDGYSGADCDDSDAATSPGAVDTCNGLDDDCSGTADDGTVPCGSLDTSYAGASFFGVGSGDYVGNHISPGGDFNADGVEDFLVGGEGDMSSGGSAGPSFVVYGPVSGSHDLPDGAAQLNTSSAWAGGTVAGIGDSNGDGYDDLVVGEYWYSDRSGIAYLVHGPVTGDVTLSSEILLGSESAYSYAGGAVAGAGDMNADGYDDILIGAYGYSYPSTQGRTYLIHGPVTASMSLGSADVKLTGTSSMDFSGNSLAGGRDVDGDGVPDIIIGASHESTAFGYAGAAYVVLGPLMADMTMSASDGMWTGVESNGNVGFNVKWAGDVDGDGLEDFLVPNGGQYRSSTYGAFLVLGPGTGSNSLVSADAVFYSESSTDRGGCVASGGDLDGDGSIDLAFSAIYAGYGGSNSGRVYLFYGATTGSHYLADADSTIDGTAADEQFGTDLDLGIDANDDGVMDLVVGASNDSTVDYRAGAAHVFFGGP